MKRMIACEKCSKRKIVEYKGEWFKQVHGTAKNHYMCDWCGISIQPDGKCAAESFGVNGVGIPYYSWEDEFINIKLSPMKIWTFEVNHPGEEAAGIRPFSDTVTVSVESGDPGGDEAGCSFQEHIVSALEDWYDGTKVELVEEDKK